MKERGDSDKFSSVSQTSSRATRSNLERFSAEGNGTI